MKLFNTKSVVSFYLILPLLSSTTVNAKTLYLDMNTSMTTEVLGIDKATNQGHPTTSNIEQIISDYAKKHQVQPELLKAIIRQESNFNASAISPKGARGLMQVMPATAASYGRYNLMLPRDNIEVGTRHLSYLLKRYDQLPLVLAAYNAGEGNVDKYKGIPPFAETQNYVLNVLQFYNTELDNRLTAMNRDMSPLNTRLVLLPTKKITPLEENKETSTNKSKIAQSRVLYFSMAE